ncbi:kinase-like domain-containing protein [Gigaspora margarita]|uniref:Kinase-like domain-containing protein n=1 Tax=Gigaspora margarita TaxID=4874 RepID=A0A8H4EHU4_GIGMA|nr:kinase-like domain-containing protein [Gigaspora margarita]
MPKLEQCSKPENIVEWVPYENFKDVKYETKGGVGSIYSAIWTDGWFSGWDNKNKQFTRIGEKQTMSHIMFSSQGSRGIQCHGLTRFPKTEDFMLVLDYMKKW